MANIDALFNKISRGDGRITAPDMARYLKQNLDKDKNGLLNTANGEVRKARNALGINIVRYFYSTFKENPALKDVSSADLGSSSGIFTKNGEANYFGTNISGELSYNLVMRGAGKEWRKGMTIDQFKNLVKRYGR